MSEPFVVTVGWSTRAEAGQAGHEAASSALEQLSAFVPKLAIVFGSSWFDQPALLQGIRSVLGTTPLIGASTAGEITPRGPISHSCVVVLIASEAIVCSVGTGEEVHQNPREAGQRTAYAAIKGFHGSTRTGFLFFGDGLVTSYADVVRGLQEVLGTGTLIVGGMAGDDLRFTQTYQYCSDRALTQAIVGVLLGGSISMGVGIEHGFAPISKPRRITHAKANRLMQLDRQPAASIYEDYFGQEFVDRMRTEGLTRQGIAYPLGIQSDTMDQWVLRNVVSVERDGSLMCSGEIPKGSWVQFMMGSRELALEAARKAALQATRSVSHLGGVLVFDSAVRRKLLGPQHVAVEIAAIREAIGPSTPLAGCYTYGEQAPPGSALTYERTATQTGSVLVIALGM